MPADAQFERLFIMPTTGTKMYRHNDARWQAVYTDLFADEEKALIIAAFHASLGRYWVQARTDLGRADRGSRQPDYLLRAWPGGTGRGQGFLGS